MFKRSLVLVIAVLLVVTMMAGCGQKANPVTTPTASDSTSPSQSSTPSATPEAEPATINFIQNSANGGHEDDLKAMLDDFMKKNPDITVKYEIIPWVEYYTKLNIVLSSGEGTPDVFEVGYENFAQYAMNDQLYNLNDVIAADKDFDPDSIKKTLFDAYKYDGKQLGVPVANNGCIMYYNKDLFDAKGVSYPTPEWTWQDELAAAQKLTDESQGIWGTVAPIQTYEFYKTAAQNGGTFWDGKTCTINSKANVDALTWMIEKSTKYKVQAPVTSDIMTQSDADTNAFISGKVAMLRGGIWQIGRLAQEATFKWDVMVEPGNVAKAHNSFVEGLAVSKTTKYPEAAWKLMKYLATDKDAVSIRIAKGWNIPVVNDDSIMAAYYAVTPPESRKYVAALNDSSVMPPLGPIPQSWGDLVSIVNEEIDKAKNGVLTPQAAMDEAKTRLEKLVK
ncbi:MAG: sugar ABC transporter substrate-binding protein [Clostridia bacterium]|nr:sugar ABC transporter substrate-binding protein [Clostridia bacterium]